MHQVQIFKVILFNLLKNVLQVILYELVEDKIKILGNINMYLV